MYKYVAQIFNILVLLVVGVAMIGVNVSKLHCSQCKEVFTEVKIVPEEASCPCKHGCPCCTDTKKEQNYPETDHTFYKITDFSQEEKVVFVSLSLFIPVERLLFERIFLIYFEYEHVSDVYRYPDAHPPLEFLCVYRC